MILFTAMIYILGGISFCGLIASLKNSGVLVGNVTPINMIVIFLIWPICIVYTISEIVKALK